MYPFALVIINDFPAEFAEQFKEPFLLALCNEFTEGPVDGCLLRFLVADFQRFSEQASFYC